MMLGIKSHKAFLRASIRRRRSQLRSNPDYRSFLAQEFEKNSKDLFSFLKEGDAVVAFLPLVHEPPIEKILLNLINRKINIFVPVVKPSRQLAWVRWVPDAPSVHNVIGIDEPVGEEYGSEIFLDADIRLMPALAVDIEGHRLGQGGGFYDTLCAAMTEQHLQSTYTVIFDEDLLDGLPYEEHDFITPAVLTPSGPRRLRS